MEVVLDSGIIVENISNKLKLKSGIRIGSGQTFSVVLAETHLLQGCDPA